MTRTLACVLTALCAAACAAAEDFRLDETPTGVRLLRGTSVVWNLELDTPEGRPFFHPLTLPSGRSFTDLRPRDHVWHLGYWFSWKFVNGVNYWEPADAARRGAEPAGRTRVKTRQVERNGLGCTVRLTLGYGPRASDEEVLEEVRTIVVSPPTPDGGYAIETTHRFTARSAVTLERTPPHGDVAKGRWGGGYAGATLRLAPDAAQAFRVSGRCGGTSPATCTGRETDAVILSHAAAGEQVVFEQLIAPAGSVFYLWKDARMINPSPVYQAPLSLKRGEALTLSYRLRIGRSAL